MLNLWLNQTDRFLCHNIKSAFESLEDNYKQTKQSLNIFQELKNLQMDPFVSTTSGATKFEKTLKMKLKIVVGTFFVFIPLLSFLLLSYILEINYSYAFISTFAVAIFASTRMDKIASKYSDFRHSLS